MSLTRDRIGITVFAPIFVVVVLATWQAFQPALAHGAAQAKKAAAGGQADVDADADADVGGDADAGAGGDADADGGAAAPPARKALPTSKLKQNGIMSAVKTTAEKLKASVSKACRKCKGDGKIKMRKIGGGRPGEKDCPDCEEGQVPNEAAKITAAAVAVATAITRMAPEAPGADVALQEAYDAITEVILRDRARYLALQKQSTFALSSSKPPVGKVVMLKAEFAKEIEHPFKKGERLYIMRIPHKKLTVAVVAPKHAELPPEGGRTLVAGAIAGTADLDGGRAVLLEYGFITSPNVDSDWWVTQW